MYKGTYSTFIRHKINKKFDIVYFIMYIGTMSTKMKSKINQLLTTTPHGVVLLSSWLANKGYSLDLLKRYKKSQWLESIGSGAMIRCGDSVDYNGAVYALQTQISLSIHAGGKTALALLGKLHYLELSPKKAVLFGFSGEKLPRWFANHNWQMGVEYHSTSFLPSELGLIDFKIKDFSIKISSAARAIMECLYLAPEKQELQECYELMEGLNNLRPTLVQELLEQCSSIKVKRLFLYLAEKAGHQWLQYLDLKKIDLGSGKRRLVVHGTYVEKYKITVPRGLAQNEK